MERRKEKKRDIQKATERDREIHSEKETNRGTDKER